MAVFQYTARDASGGQTSGTINSPDRNVAVSELMNQGLTPISVTGDGDSVSASTRRSSVDEQAPVRRFGRRRKKPKLQELANFTRQLANLLKAGMPLTGALNSMTSLDSEGIPKSVCVCYSLSGSIPGASTYYPFFPRCNSVHISTGTT